MCDKLIQAKGFNSKVNLKLFNAKSDLQGIDYNIKKFKDIAPDAVKDLVKAKENKKLYEKLLAGKFIASTGIPILFMGFILPKLVFASSAKKIEALRKKEAEKKQANFVQKDKFINFTGANWVQKIANFSAQDKMAVTDGGYSIGRVATARNKNETIDISFKMAGMMFLNYVAPKWIEKGLNKLTGVELDPIILADEKFLSKINTNTLKLPKTDSAKDLFDFIDDIKNKDTLFIKYAKKFEKITMLDDNIRDPRAFVDTEALGKFRNDLENFAKKVKLGGEGVLKKAKFAKSANILTNITLSSFLLAYALPKAQFAFRKLVTGSDLEPGLAPAKKNI